MSRSWEVIVHMFCIGALNVHRILGRTLTTGICSQENNLYDEEPGRKPLWRMVGAIGLV